MGRTEIVVNVGIHNAKTEVREGELFCDRDHPSRRYVQMGPREPIQPLFDETSRTDETSPLKPLTSRPRLAGSYDSAPAEAPSRPA